MDEVQLVVQGEELLQVLPLVHQLVVHLVDQLVVRLVLLESS